MLRSRRQTYALLVGVVVGMLAAGLAVPLIFGEQLGSSTATRPGMVATGQEGDRGGDLTGGAATADVLASQGAAPEPGPGPADAQGGSEPTALAAGASPPAEGGAGVGSTTPARTASEPGVTPTSIKVGFILLDLGTAAQIGFVVGLDPEEQQEMWQAFVDDVNGRGGIHGRTIEPVYRKVDVVEGDSARAACLAFTDDERVFSVVGRFVDPPAAQCVTERKQTLLVENNSLPDEYYRTGLLVTMFPTTNRVVANFAAELGRMKLLTGRNVGILSDEGTDPGGAGAARFEREVRRSKPSAVQTGRLSDDLATGSSQIPLIVNSMRTAGVDTVLFIANPIYSTQFVNEAESQRWFPTYAASDFASMANQDSGTMNMPDSFDGALGITSQRLNEHLVALPPPATAVECRRVVKDHRGGESYDPGSTEDRVLLTQCDQFRVFVAGAERAGPMLTRRSWSDAIQQLGPRAGAQTASGSFRPGKFDFADRLRPERWRSDCKCWKPDGDFRDPAYF